MPQMIEIAVELETVTCCYSECGLTFAVPNAWVRSRRKDHSWWYCPNGHQQHYSGKTEEEVLKAKLKEVEKQRDHWIARTDQERAAVKELERSRSAVRGVVTRLKNKAKAGECAFCHQTFDDYRTHVEEVHWGEDPNAEEGEE